MKKKIFYLLLITCFLISGCQKKERPDEETEIIIVTQEEIIKTTNTHSEYFEDLIRKRLPLDNIDINEFLLGYWYPPDKHYSSDTLSRPSNSSADEVVRFNTDTDSSAFINFDIDSEFSQITEKNWESHEGTWQAEKRGDIISITLNLYNIYWEKSEKGWQEKWEIYVIGQNYIIIVNASKQILEYTRENSKIKNIIDNDDIEELKLYFKEGGFFDERMIFNLTPLMYSIQTKKFDITLFLIEQGADLSLQSSIGYTPLHYAVRHSVLEDNILSSILEKGADVNAIDIRGQTVLDLTIFHRRRNYRNEIDINRNENTIKIRKLLSSYGAFCSRDIWQNEIDETINLLMTFHGHTDEVLSVALSPDGKYALSGSADRTIKLWDTATGSEIRTLSGHSGYVSSVAFNSDGSQFISGSHDKTVKLWDTAAGKEIRTFTGHPEYITSVGFSLDGRQIISGSYDGSIRFWDISTGREIKIFSSSSKRRNDVLSFSLSPDGKNLLSCGNEEIKIWEMNTGNEVWSIPLDGNSAAFSPDSGKIVISSVDGIRGWDISTQRRIHDIWGIGIINSVAISPDGSKILSGGMSDYKLRFFDTAAVSNEIKVFSGHTSYVNSVVFSSDGEYILSGSSDKTVKLWKTDLDYKFIRAFSGHSKHIDSITFSPNGRQVISGSYDTTIKLWDVSTHQEIMTFSGHTSAVRTVAFSPDGNQIISGSSDNTIKLWDVITGNEIMTFTGHSDDVLYTAFNPDGRQIISRSFDGSIKLWDILTGNEIRTFFDASYGVRTVAFSPDGRLIITGLTDCTIILWDVLTGNMIRTFFDDSDLAFNSYVASVDFSPDGKYVISAYDGIYLGNERTIKLWDVSTGSVIKTFSGHSNLKSVIFSPDGKYILSVSYHYTIKLWDVSTGSEVISFFGQLAAFSPDGKQVIISYLDDILLLIDLTTGKAVVRNISDISSSTSTLSK